MKKFTLLFLLAILAGGFSAEAQIQKGNVLVGSNFADINLGLNYPHVFTFNVTPKAAWFVEDNLALGGYVNLAIETANDSRTATSYGFGGLGRYYAGSDMTVLKHGRFFGEATVGFGGTNISDGGGNTNGLALSVGPGFAYFVTPNIGLETLLKFNGLAGFGNQSFRSNLDLSFGLQVYLPGQRTANKIKSDMK
ncbi:hypothetical protein [Mucilaginibacter xinganensis]|uniref:Outer membrane protein beta-barrel domain-containing protein n=1 Tax=Mucilaginibacter xinganensis TaxID=1234841 RepID=A0A223NQK0_9SPHI|nr:hypothetical protein [Mucilaginibacter xinganensis]ASU32076.1 hypothetical protein MuYL_0173 [Mucilaginibacter xinganensis]